MATNEQHGHSTIQCSYGWYRRWCKRFGLSTSPHDSTDSEILCWLLQQYDENNLVTYKKLQSFVQEQSSLSSSSSSSSSYQLQAPAAGAAGGGGTRFHAHFKASHGWATRFFKRNHLLINWQGHYTKELPIKLELAIQQFLKTEIFASASARTVIAMDEIPLSFASNPTSESASSSLPAVSTSSSGPSPRVTVTPTTELCTAAAADSKISRLRRVTIKNCEATVLVGLMNDGTLLPPMVIVKGQKPSSWNQVYTKTDNPVVVYYAESTEPTAKSLEKWLDLILVKELQQKRSMAPLPPQSSASSASWPLLFWDSYSLHTRMKDKCGKLGIVAQTFPPGCSSRLQPINVLARRLLLKHIEGEWIKYLHDCNAHQNIRICLPSTDDIVDWVYNAFQSMVGHKESFKDSFRVVGLT